MIFPQVAERTLPYLHNCIRELSLLDVVMTPGASACWVFLSCLEILQTCENYKETAHVESYSKFTAGIWSYARQKVRPLFPSGVLPTFLLNPKFLWISILSARRIGTSVRSDAGPEADERTDSHVRSTVRGADRRIGETCGKVEEGAFVPRGVHQAVPGLYWIL